MAEGAAPRAARGEYRAGGMARIIEQRQLLQTVNNHILLSFRRTIPYHVCGQIAIGKYGEKCAAPCLTESERLSILKGNKMGKTEKNYERVFSDRTSTERQKHGDPPLFMCKFRASAGRLSHREHPDGRRI